jgi:hypothetical protein
LNARAGPASVNPISKRAMIKKLAVMSDLETRPDLTIISSSNV